MKTRYAAHLILAVDTDGPADRPIPFYENVVLVQADTDAEAMRQACRLGRAEAAADPGDFRWGGQPARWRFVGVRKLIECQPPAGRERLGYGSEVTYSQMAVRSEADLQRLAAGEPVEVTYHE